MCHCLSFLLELHPVFKPAAAASPPSSVTWVSRVLFLLSRGFHSWSHSYMPCDGLHENDHTQYHDNGSESHSGVAELSPLIPTRCNYDEIGLSGVRSVPNLKQGTDRVFPGLGKTHTNSGNDTISLYTQQGQKGTNQDSMLVWEDFIPSQDLAFYGVFDGHGMHGHHISRRIRDKLPAKLASCWQAAQVSYLMARNDDSPKGRSSMTDLNMISMWEECLHNAYKLMDKDILLNEDVDCVFSGSTALTVVKQGNDLIIANLGDSRAVLGVKFNDSLMALQLTVDLTPNLPKEAERIRRCKGRVLALRDEPFVKRVWLPHENSPGLAMARAFGDYLLKNFGVISVPEVTHRRISKNDKFVVLATDGIWNVLSNEQVVHIVDSTLNRSLVSQAVTDAAVEAWKHKYPNTKADDCAVVCLFLDSMTEAG